MKPDKYDAELSNIEIDIFEKLDYLPCPFCGGAPSIYFDHPGASYPGGYYMITCDNDNCEVSLEVSQKLQIAYLIDGARDLVNRWNKRTATDLIPKGYYCYTWLEVPNAKNNFNGKIKCCPFYNKREIDGVKVPWCDKLNLGGTDNQWEEKEWDKIGVFYKNKNLNMFDELPLDLLWDMVKHCEENMEVAEIE